jgi:putative hydrolase of the HAD superfamily
MTIPPEITTLVFDWGDTLMAVDPRFSGAMSDWPEVTAVPGVQTALAALQGRFRLAVASNAVDSNAIQVRAALERVGLAHNFSNIFTFAELNTKKPDPLFFQHAAQRLGAALHQLVMIGDSYAADIPGARRAGWRAAWYNPAGRPAPGAGPLHDLDFTQMAELPEALQRLDLPDVLACQAWYLEQEGVGNLWQHVEAVGLAAYHLAVLLRANGQMVDPLLAHRGGLLHDIAKISAKHTHANHGEMGAKILHSLGQPALAEISRRHMIFCLTDPQQAPRTWEEKIVHFADKICEGARFVEWSERLAGLTSRYPDQVEALRGCTPAVLALQAELAAAAGFASQDLVAQLRQANNR